MEQRNCIKKLKTYNKRVSYGKLLEKRIIYLNGKIDDILAGDIIYLLFKFDMENHKDITMFINSIGGSVSSGLAIYDAMNLIKSNIVTIGIGRCTSMASILLINGTKGKRCLMPNAEVMIHEISYHTGGTITDIYESLEHSKKVNERLLHIIANKTKKSLGQIRREIEGKDVWINADMALKYGFVDKVLR